ncbi:MAG: hypothetical protein LBD97_08785 [Bifidobacteriaceae bacterium]|jgi:hypothetical protein|nr:hypothetical protein [Bifidobacteriaceae bacterium]
MDQQTLDLPTATKRRFSKGLVALAAAAALSLGGAGAAYAATGHTTGEYDAWEVHIHDGEIELHTHGHDNAPWDDGDWFVTDNDGFIYGPWDSPDLEVGFSTEDAYAGTGFTGSITFTITDVTYDDGSNPPDDGTLIVRNAGGANELFNTGASDFSESFGSGTQHDHWEWEFADGSGTYEVTVAASSTGSFFDASDPYTVTFVVP